jgi:hypothetical protein
VLGNSTHGNVSEIDDFKVRVTRIEKNALSDTKSKISYDIKIYPFYTNLYMPPFPPGYVSHNFMKYRGKTNPIEHIREFATNCIDIAYEPTYLMRLFLKSLAGPTLEWFVS